MRGGGVLPHRCPPRALAAHAHEPRVARPVFSRFSEPSGVEPLNSKGLPATGYCRFTGSQRTREAEQPLAGQSDQAKPISLFYSYSHKDEELRLRLETHLAALRRGGLIAEWHDRKLEPGDAWKAEIDRHLTSADIVLLLVSSDFIASDYCWGEEMTKALARHARDEARVIPVILRHCHWRSTPLASLQAVPKDAKPIKSWPDEDEAFDDVVAAIERSVQETRRRTEEETRAEEEARERALEQARGRALEQARGRAEEDARQRKARHQGEEEARQLAEEEARRQLEEDAGRRAEEQQQRAATQTSIPSERAPGTVFRDIDAPWCPELVVIPAGSFVMGSPKDEAERRDAEGPQHRVTFASPFALGKFPVTFAEYDHFCVETGRAQPPDQISGRGWWGRGRGGAAGGR